MGLLKKIGQIVAQVGLIAAGLEPVARGLFPKAGASIERGVDTIGQVSAIIVNVEAIGAVLGTPARALATAIGCSDQYLSDVLRKRRLPGPRICRALQMDAEIRFVESA
jgi:hypothetical protein